MPTIQKRLRYHASVRSNGTVLATRSFGRESQARGWAARETEAIARQGRVDDLASAVKQHASYRVMVRLRGYPTQYVLAAALKRG